MKLEQALFEQANIECLNDTQKADVLNILHFGGVTIHPDIIFHKDGMFVTLFTSNQYTILNYCSEFGTELPASDFLASNDPHTF